MKEFPHVNPFRPEVVIFDGVNVLLSNGDFEALEMIVTLRNFFHVDEFDAAVFRPCFDVVGRAFNIGVC